MIPQIQCHYHPGKDIVIIDLGKHKIANSRLFCLSCVENNELKQPLPLERFLDQAKQFGKTKMMEIQAEKDVLKQKFFKLQKQMHIYKDLVILQLDKMQQEIKKVFRDLQQWMQNEEAKYEDLINNITQNKLESLSRLLSGDEVPGSIVNYLKEILCQFQKDLDSDFRNLITEQQMAIQHIDNTINPKLLIQSETNLSKPCSILVSNPSLSLIIGAVANEIIIWQQIESQLIEQVGILAHIGTITGLGLYNTGNIVSGGGNEDKQLKLWHQDKQEWNCFYILPLPVGIASLQITPDQEQIIISRLDNYIQILIMIQGQLEIIQNLIENHISVYITISQNSEIFATSNWGNFINIYFQDLDFQQWKYFQKIESIGTIHRIHFINNEEIICQQLNPPKLLIYKMNSQGPFEATYELQLWENDDNCVQGFPITIIKGLIYCKNELFFYVINRSQGNKYEVEYIVAGEFTAGCVDQKGTRLIVKNQSTNKIETYGKDLMF